MALHYLTVQDMIWINLQVTGTVQEWHYMRLEEGTFYQYAYGTSTNLIPQAARFVAGFMKNAPFTAGNEATALIGVLTFLEMNGMSVSLTDAVASDWLHACSSAESAQTKIESIASESHDGHHDLVPDVNAIAAGIIARFPTTLARLNSVAVS